MKNLQSVTVLTEIVPFRLFHFLTSTKQLNLYQKQLNLYQTTQLLPINSTSTKQLNLYQKQLNLY